MHPGLNSLYPTGIIEIEIMPMKIQNRYFSLEKEIKRYCSEFKNTIKIIDSTNHSYNRILIFSGFNPLLHPDILEICSYAKKNDFIIGLASAIPINEYDIPDSLGCDVDWMIMPDCSIENMINKSKQTVFDKLDEISEVRDIIRNENIGLHLYSEVNHFNSGEDFSCLAITADPDIMTFILHYATIREDNSEKDNFLSETDLIGFMSKNRDLRLPNGLRPAIMYSDDPRLNCLRFNACQNI